MFGDNASSVNQFFNAQQATRPQASLLPNRTKRTASIIWYPQGEHDSHHNKVISLSPSVNTANQYIRVVESVICRLTVTLESATIASTAERP